MQLSQHFTLAEMACKCGCGGENKPEILTNLKALANALEVLRLAAGKTAVHINCAYRCPAHNKAVGGEDQSLHLTGKAADIRIEGQEPGKTQAVAQLVAVLGGVGSYKTFTHVDIRPRTKGLQARWSG